MRNVKGIKDIGPDNARLFEYLVEHIKEKLKLYGFKPLDLACIEYIDVLTAKSGEGIMGEIFKIKDSDYGLRFDLTVSTSRFVANTNLTKPFKMYSVGKVWRREEPQKGRRREFYQFDINIFGSRSMRADAEILNLSYEILKSLGFKFDVLINNRKILNAFVKKYDIKQKNEFLRLLDKTDKIGRDEVKKRVKELLKNNQYLDEILSFMDADLKKIGEISKEGFDEINKLMDLLEFKANFDMNLVRGLGYYTGPIFEFRLDSGLTIAGGGRFDNLLSLYGQSDFATGIGLGITRMMDLMKNKIKEPFSFVYILSFPETYKNALNLANEIREYGIPCEVDLNERKIKKQLEYAASSNIPYVIFLGKDEIEKKRLTLKNMSSGKQIEGPSKEIIEVIVRAWENEKRDKNIFKK